VYVRTYVRRRTSLTFADSYVLFIFSIFFISHQVNIAQFHVMCGAGVLYGTKRGKVRVFRRHEYEQTSHIGTGTGIATDYQDLSMSSSSV
jgi:hypothetical protein